MPPFIVFALPRSRTAWLSRFLTYGDWTCGHDETRHFRSTGDAQTWLTQFCIGSAETAAAPFWRLIQRWQPDIRVVVVRRPAAEVVDSLMRLNLGFDRGALVWGMRRLNRKLDQIEHRMAGVLSVTFEDLKNEATCARVFEHCLPYRHDSRWWAHWAPQNLQIDMRAMMKYYRAFQPQIDKLTATARQQTIATMMPGRGEIEGVTFQQEPFDDFYRDGTPLFREHMAVTGQDIEDYTRKNLSLMRCMEARGNLQVTTARSNGRMFGYLMAIVGESMDAVGLLEGMHMAFYASKEIPGLGLKLQRASIESLRSKGVGDLYFRAGTRGSGPRLGAMYRRLGAEDAGHLYHLRMKEAS